MKSLIFAFLLVSGAAHAARLEDVRLLNYMPGKENLELKLQTNDGPKDSYFYVDITKSDPDAFEKLIEVIKKMNKKEAYKLTLDIVSFSRFPSGSYYKSEGILFTGSSDQAPNSVKKTKDSH